jgi:hypothetical protein
VWESNPPLRLERAVSLADRRTSHFPGVGRGALESPSAGLQPAARPSQLPTRSVVPTKRPGVLVTPGLRLRTRDVRGQASRPQGIAPKRRRRRIGGSLRFLATQDVTRTPGKHGRPRCKGCLRPTRLGPTSRLARRLVPLQTRHPERMFARFRKKSLFRARSRESPTTGSLNPLRQQQGEAIIRVPW